MSLTLTVISYRQQPMARPLSERFEASRITLGRAPDNDWTLPDPDQLISKKHCTIQVQGGRYALTDTSTNGVFINGSPQPVGQGQSMPLADGDRLAIGGYEIQVKIDGIQPQAASAPARPQPAPPAAPLDDPFGLETFASVQGVAPGPSPLPPFSSQPPSASPFGSGFPSAGEDPFGLDPVAPAPGFTGPPGAPILPDKPDWLMDPAPPTGEIAADQFAQGDHVPAEHVHYRPPGVVAHEPPRTGGGLAIPDNWDPLAEPAEAVIPIIQPPPAPPRMPPRVQPPPQPEPQPQPFNPGGMRPGAMSPPLGHFAAPDAMPRAPQPAESRAVPPAMPRPGPPPSPVQPAGAFAGAGGAALLAAFLEGAGLRAESVREDPATLLAAAGRLFRELALGLRDALTTRSMIKTEYRVEQTVIRAANNNPLKFAADVDELLASLLTRPRQGYMGGGQAVQEGFKDIRAHELAVQAGMQAAVAALLRQLGPEQMKQRLDQQSLLHNLVPAARKAKYWEMYEQHYKQIAADVSENVRGTFGRAFAEAYEEQAKKL